MSEAKELLTTWKDNYTVGTFGVDFTGKTPLYSLCNFLQESAWNHANHLGFGYSNLLENNQLWVLSRLFLKIFKYPKMGDKIKVLTWPSGIEGIFALRDYEILDENDNRICSGVSAWLILNIETRRPVRTDQAIGSLRPTNPRRSLEIKMDKLPPLINPIVKGTIKANYSDLDVNNHVNNTKYIEWILNNYSIETLSKKVPSEFEINFLSESFYNDRINILMEEKDSTTQIHSLIRIDDKKEICRARIVWREY